MAKSGNEPANETNKSLAQRFMDHARSPMGLASIVQEVKFALTDIRHKVVEEGTYGRAVTPQWQEQDTSQAGGIHGKSDAPAPEAGGVHGKMDAAPPDAGGGVQGKAVEPKPEGPAGPETEAKGLGMSYAELTASWKDAASREAGRDREPSRQPEPAIER